MFTLLSPFGLQHRMAAKLDWREIFIAVQDYLEGPDRNPHQRLSRIELGRVLGISEKSAERFHLTLIQVRSLDTVVRQDDSLKSYKLEWVLLMREMGRKPYNPILLQDVKAVQKWIQKNGQGGIAAVPAVQAMPVVPAVQAVPAVEAVPAVQAVPVVQDIEAVPAVEAVPVVQDVEAVPVVQAVPAVQALEAEPVVQVVEAVPAVEAAPLVQPVQDLPASPEIPAVPAVLSAGAVPFIAARIDGAHEVEVQGSDLEEDQDRNDGNVVIIRSPFAYYCVTCRSLNHLMGLIGTAGQARLRRVKCQSCNAFG